MEYINVKMIIIGLSLRFCKYYILPEFSFCIFTDITKVGNETQFSIKSALSTKYKSYNYEVSAYSKCIFMLSPIIWLIFCKIKPCTETPVIWVSIYGK